MRYAAALGLLLVACGTDAEPRTRVDVAVRNARTSDVVVTPWDGAAEVVVRAGGMAPVQADAPPPPWRFRVVERASGRELHTTDLRLDGAHAVVVTDAASVADPTRDGADVEEPA